MRVCSYVYGSSCKSQKYSQHFLLKLLPLHRDGDQILENVVGALTGTLNHFQNSHCSPHTLYYVQICRLIFNLLLNRSLEWSISLWVFTHLLLLLLLQHHQRPLIRSAHFAHFLWFNGNISSVPLDDYICIEFMENICTHTYPHWKPSEKWCNSLFQTNSRARALSLSLERSASKTHIEWGEKISQTKDVIWKWIDLCNYINMYESHTEVAYSRKEWWNRHIWLHAGCHWALLMSELL